MPDDDRYTQALVYLIDNVPELGKALEESITRMVADLGPFLATMQDALWAYVPSCPCYRCEDHRWNNGLTCMYGVGPRPEPPPEHNWQGQVVFAGLNQNPQVGNSDSAPETGPNSLLSCTCMPDKSVSNFCALHGDPTNPGGDCK